MLRAWHTIVDEGVEDYSRDKEDHDEHENDRNGMEIGVKREDPMSQESQGESLSSPILTSCTISQCIVDQIPSIFYGELHNFDVLNEGDDAINLFVDYFEIDQENVCNSKVKECLDELYDDTLKKNDDLSLLLDEENYIINAFVSSLDLERDFFFLT
ncbi:hypothetical protein L7F22_055930 [Adiantum nelumboides]|nr:hypothetical protein [Adiantum nelumboides]